MKTFFEWIKLNEMPLISIKGKSAFADDEKLKNVNIDKVSNNIVMLRQPEGYTLVYFMDSEESAQDMKAGKIPNLIREYKTLLMALWNRGVASEAKPLADIWSKDHAKPGTEHIIGAIECDTFENLIYIEMMTVRPEYRRNSINSKMIQYIKSQFPGAQLVYSSPTKDGEKFIKSFT